MVHILNVDVPVDLLALVHLIGHNVCDDGCVLPRIPQLAVRLIRAVHALLSDSVHDAHPHTNRSAEPASGKVCGHVWIVGNQFRDRRRRKGEFALGRCRPELIVSRQSYHSLGPACHLRVLEEELIQACIIAKAVSVGLGEQFGAAHERQVLTPSEMIKVAIAHSQKSGRLRGRHFD